MSKLLGYTGAVLEASGILIFLPLMLSEIEVFCLLLEWWNILPLSPLDGGGSAS